MKKYLIAAALFVGLFCIVLHGQTSGNYGVLNVWSGITGVIGWEPKDTGISRHAAGVTRIGNGGFDDASGTLQTATGTFGTALTVAGNNVCQSTGTNCPSSSPSFSTLTTGTNTTGTFIVGSGATLTASGSGVIQATGASNLSNGALGSAVYQTATSATGFLASPTTANHTFVFAWQPTGSAIAPVALDTLNLPSTHQLYFNLQPGAFSTSTVIGAVYQEPATALMNAITIRQSGTISCTAAPGFVLLDLGTSASTAYGSATIISEFSTGTSDGVYTASSAPLAVGITAGHYYGIGFNGGTCATAPTFDISVLVQ